MKSIVLPPRLELQLPGGVGMEFCLIEHGKFRMGSRGYSEVEEPIHEVEITQDFYLGKFPVTQVQFGAWTNTKEYKAWFDSNRELVNRTSYFDEAEPHKNDFKGDDRPAEKVTWWEARQFGRWLKEIGVLEEKWHRMFGSALDSGLWQARLPTEAEWEYACRAGTETEYWNGDGEAALEEIAWYDGNSRAQTHPVGEKPENSWALCDMHGNVFEWSLDVWDGEAYRLREHGVKDPVVLGTGETDEGFRVLRGGSWYYGAGSCRSAYRRWIWPGIRLGDYGFRLALVPGPAEPGEAGGREEKRAERAGGAEPRRDDESAAEARAERTTVN